MVPKSSDPEAKTVDALAQLRQALYSISGALKVIADAVPSLLPPDKVSAAPQPIASLSHDGNQPESGSLPLSNKRKRKEKDPDAPEKPPSAYHLYAKEKRDEIRAAMAGTPSGNDVVQELNRRWKALTEDLKKVCILLDCNVILICQPFVDAAETLKAPYKLAMAEYEQRRKVSSDDKPDSESEPIQDIAQPPPTIKVKLAPTKGGFTAVKSAPLTVNPGSDSDTEDDSRDEAAVAADLGGSQPPSSIPPSKRQRKDHLNTKKDKKEKGKDKDKEKEKDKKKRRKSNKTDS